jgi:hypothetical protein
MGEPRTMGEFWRELEARQRICSLFKRLGWNNLRVVADVGWVVNRSPAVRLNAPTVDDLLREVEHTEVASRARRIEREETERECKAAGFFLAHGTKDGWEAARFGDPRVVLKAPSAAELRAQLRAPWAEPGDVEEIRHAG